MRTVRQALRSPRPAPRKPQPLRGSRLDPFTATIDDMLQAELQAYPPQRQPGKEIHRELVTKCGAEGISCQMVRAYDSGGGWTLLRRAIHAEAARHPGAGDPLHADMTTFLLARGASPQAAMVPAETEAELLGHWLAAEIIRAWTKRPR